MKINILKLKNWIKANYSLEKKFKKSYSQCGEDLIIRFIFNLLKNANPTYIDIGANHPTLLNNTYLFYKEGSKGITIEPNLSLHKKLKGKRRRDINLCMGISDTPGSMDFYRFHPHTMSTFSKDEAEKLQNEYGYILEEVIKVKLDTLQSIISKYCNGIFPDLLSLDVEGLDEQILRSIDFEKSTPTIIVTETSHFSMTYKEDLKRTDIIEFLKSKGYIAYADTLINTIFVKKDKLLINN
jgi:FkbM family methyltransferase